MPAKGLQRSKSMGPSKGAIKPPAKSLKMSNILYQGAFDCVDAIPKKSLYKPAPPWIPPPCLAPRVPLEDLQHDIKEKSNSVANRHSPSRKKTYSEIIDSRAKADLEAARAQLRNQKAELARSREILEDQEDELLKTKTDLDMTSKVNNSLRRSVEYLRDETLLTKAEREMLETERELLSKKLLDLEFEGSEASKQMNVLRDTLNKLKEDKRLSAADISLLNKQRSLLLDKLAAFETSNRALRHILREHARKASENEALMNNFKSLEHTKGHLQKQLRSKEADCNRMAVQIRTLESKLEQDRFEMEHLHSLVKSTKETHANELHSVVEQLRAKMVSLSKDKGHLEAENANLLTRLGELESTNESLDSSARSKIDRMNQQLQDKDNLIWQLKSEIEKSKMNQVSLEDRVLAGNTELTNARATNSELEASVEDLRTQLSLARRENQDLHNKLDQSAKDIARLQHDHMLATEKGEQAQLEASRQHSKFVQSHEDNMQLAQKVEHLERKVKELEEENQELVVKQAKADENNSHLALTVEEKSREIAQLSRQLDISIQDSKRATEAAHNRLATKERTSQARLVELEAQLARAKAELSQVRRAKEDADRKFNTRLQDLRDRLEQSHVTNRSMQNYIGFLKAT